MRRGCCWVGHFAWICSLQPRFFSPAFSCAIMNHWTGQAKNPWPLETIKLETSQQHFHSWVSCRERLAAKNGNGLSHRFGFEPAIVLRLLGALFQLYVLQICGFQLLLVPWPRAIMKISININIQYTSTENMTRALTERHHLFDCMSNTNAKFEWALLAPFLSQPKRRTSINKQVSHRSHIRR